MMIKSGMKYLLRRYGGYYLDINGIKEKLKLIVSEQGSILDKIGFIEDTDKSSLRRGGILGEEVLIAHDYLRHYDFLFNSFRADKFSLLEFGCFKGDSLRTWEQYFPKAEIYGVDLDEECRKYEKGRVHIFIGNATSQKTYDEIKSKINSAFIILDDASHAWGDQRVSFELFWDLVKPGGFYVIEDLECGTLGAFSEYPPKILDSQPFCDYMHDISKILRWAPDRNPEKNSYHFNHLPEKIQKIEREMDMCIFIPGAVVVRKKA